MEIDPALVLQLPDSFDPNSGFEGGFRFTEELLERKKTIHGVDGLRRFDGAGGDRALTRAG